MNNTEILRRQAAEILRQDVEIERLRTQILRLHRQIVETELIAARLREDADNGR